MCTVACPVGIIYMDGAVVNIKGISHNSAERNPGIFITRASPKWSLFLQAGSELAAINMVYGASAAGARVMTTSSSPGVALMHEGVSLLAAA